MADPASTGSASDGPTTAGSPHADPVAVQRVPPGPPSFGYGQGWKHYKTGAVDRAEAVWRLLADRGNAWAQYGLGLLHDPREGTAAADTAAIAARWYRKAAGQGLPQAQDKLALLYATGAGPLSRDPARAVLLWQTAAQRSYAPAVDHLLAFKVAEAQASAPPAQMAEGPATRTVAVEDLRAAVDTASYCASKPSARNVNAARANSWYKLAKRAQPSAPDAPGTGSDPERLTAPRPEPTGAPERVKPMDRQERTPVGRRPVAAAPEAERAYILQLGSLLSLDDAARKQVRMRRLFSDVLRDLPSGITYDGRHYRIRTDTRLSLSDAGQRCRKIRAAGQACMILKRPAPATGLIGSGAPDRRR